MVQGLAPVERRLPPPEDLGRGVERLKYFRLKYKYIDPIHNSHRSSSFCSTSSRHAPSLKWIPPPATPCLQALREGGVDGVVEELALTERRLPPPECLENWVRWPKKNLSTTSDDDNDEHRDRRRATPIDG